MFGIAVVSPITNLSWKLLTKETSEKVRKGNYERIFDEARQKVRNWEGTHRN